MIEDEEGIDSCFTLCGKTGNDSWIENRFTSTNGFNLCGYNAYRPPGASVWFGVGRGQEVRCARNKNRKKKTDLDFHHEILLGLGKKVEVLYSARAQDGPQDM